MADPLPTPPPSKTLPPSQAAGKRVSRPRAKLVTGARRHATLPYLQRCSETESDPPEEGPQAPPAPECQVTNVEEEAPPKTTSDVRGRYAYIYGLGEKRDPNTPS
jgi:hypothetical protein